MTIQDLINRLKANPQLMEQPGFCGEWLAKAHQIYDGDFLKMGTDLATIISIYRNLPHP